MWNKLKTHDMKMSSWNFETYQTKYDKHFDYYTRFGNIGKTIYDLRNALNYHCVFAIRYFSQSSFIRKSLIIFYYICKYILLIFVYHSPWMDSANIFLIINIFEFFSFSTRFLSSKHFGINNMINKWNQFVTSVFLLYYV